MCLEWVGLTARRGAGGKKHFFSVRSEIIENLFFCSICEKNTKENLLSVQSETKMSGIFPSFGSEPKTSGAPYLSQPKKKFMSKLWLFFVG
jgi:hypothetical protein